MRRVITYPDSGSQIRSRNSTAEDRLERRLLEKYGRAVTQGVLVVVVVFFAFSRVVNANEHAKFREVSK